MFYTGGMFQFATPHPPNTIPHGPNNVTNPGIPGPISAGIDKAFEQEDPRGTAEVLVDTYKKHTDQIQGLYMGSISTPGGPVPTPVPWVGIK